MHCLVYKQTLLFLNLLNHPLLALNKSLSALVPGVSFRRSACSIFAFSPIIAPKYCHLLNAFYPNQQFFYFIACDHCFFHTHGNISTLDGLFWNCVNIHFASNKSKNPQKYSKHDFLRCWQGRFSGKLTWIHPLLCGLRDAFCLADV